MTAALGLFVSGLVQLALIYGWRNSFLKNCVRDDKEYSPEEQVQASMEGQNNGFEESEMVELNRPD